MSSPATAPRPPSARWALASLSLCMLLSSLGTSIANVGLPALAHAFGASFQAVQWIVLAYLLSVTSLIVSVGRIGDLVGRRRLLLAGLGLFTLASLACGLAPTLWFLIAARAAQGLGAATMMALAVAMVGELVPKERTGSAMGLLGTMSAIGTALGPSLGGILVATLDWRALFMTSVPPGLAALYLAHRTLPGDRRDLAARGIRFDALGTLLLALSLGAFALALTGGPGRSRALTLAWLAAAGGGAGWFWLIEKRAASPLIDVRMFRDRALTSSLATSVLVATVMMATLVVGPFYLSRSVGLGAAAVGLVVAIGPLVVALAGVPAGRLVDRAGGSRTVLLGLAGLEAGAVMLALLPARLGVLAYIAPLVVLTAGYALFQTANTTAVMAAAVAEERGVRSGLLSLSRNLGLVLGTALLGAVFALASGGGELALARPAAVATGLRVTFGAAAGLIALALAVVGSHRGRTASAR